MKSIDQRLNNIIGQMEGVKKMLAGNCDCVKTLTQLKAIKSAVAGVMDTIVEDKFDTCLESMNKEDKKLLIEIKKYVKSN
ncbi:metal-sensitive transcriptional regulator [Candidatus Shapirobacteria bacterium]|nr:metal-sensitive transcriptional regulator [Candidatus Shapirobacteria bacterium]